MKSILLVILASFVMTPAMAIDQNDLDQLNSFQDVVENIEFDSEGFQGEELVDNIFFGRRNFRCIAENGRGMEFRGKGDNRRMARRRAMMKCRRNSRRPRSCEVVSCRRKGGKLNDFLDLIELIDQLSKKKKN